MNDVPMPDRIAQLERDSRGYPVPFIVLKDPSGKHQFAVNDIQRTWEAVRENLCHICGQKLDSNPWFVGGPASALLNDDRAVYHDGPMHHDCMQYALRVCPHLTQIMTRSLDLGPIKERLANQGIGTWDNTVIPGVPEIFVAVQAWRFGVYQDQGGPQFHVFKPYKKMEYWQHGEMCERREGIRIAKRAARVVSEKAKKIGR